MSDLKPILFDYIFVYYYQSIIEIIIFYLPIMQIISDCSIFSNLKLKHTQNNNNCLVLTSPFYIDRKTRTPILHSPRCLKSLDSSRYKQQKGETVKQSGIKQIRIQKSQQMMQWNSKNTKIFKQKLKQLLTEYHKIREEQKQELKQKIQVQRLQNIARISKTIQQLLLKNKKMYNFIKSKYQSHSVKPLSNKKNNQQKKQTYHNQLNGQNLQFISKFRRLFSYQNANVLNNSKQKREQKPTKIHDYFKNLEKLQKVIEQFQIEQNKSLQLRKPSARQQKNYFRPKDGSCQSERNKYSKDQQKLNQKQLQQIIIQLSKQNGSLLTNANYQQLSERLNCGDSGSDKFYSVIKALITKSKNDRQQSHQKRKGIISNNKSISNQDIQELKKIYYKSQEKKHSSEFSETIQSNLKASMRSSKSKNLTKNIKVAAQRARQLKKNSQQPKKGDKNQNINRRQVNKSKQQKGDRKQREKKKKLQKKNKFEQQDEKQNKQKKDKKIKIGLNYAKFLGRMVKLSQNQRSQHGRLSKFRKINTRQTFLKKNRNKISIQYIQQPPTNHSPGLSRIDQMKSNKNLQENLINLSQSSQDSKKGKMTKYQQARLMFNMRNLKYRQLSINFNGHNSGLDPYLYSQRKKRPSFCNLMVPDSENKIKSKRGSFNRRRNDERQQGNQLTMSNRSASGTRLHLSTEFSNKILNLHSQTELTKLTTFQEFDLHAVKTNITTYLRKVMQHNEKARQLYNFLMFMQESRKITLQQQEVNCSLDQFKIQKQEDEIKSIVNLIQPNIDDYQGCNNLYQYYNWNEKDMLMTNKKFLDKLDARSIQLLYWNNEQRTKMEDLAQCSLKQIQNLQI